MWVLIMAKALPLFLMLDPIGNTGILNKIICDYSPADQRRILKRECLFALLIMLFFYGFGSIFLAALDISQAAVEITGSIILTIFAMNLLFPHNSSIKFVTDGQEPYFVPIATPIIAGPSCLATIILYSHESTNKEAVMIGMLLAWVACTIIIVLAPTISRIAGKTGIKVMEQFMGLLCCILAVRLFLKGVTTFINT